MTARKVPINQQFVSNLPIDHQNEINDLRASRIAERHCNEKETVMPARSDKLVQGLHHVTAITGSAQANHAFYTEALGLRLVKRTVNFDDPGAWHLYYADEGGTPGTVMTFFAWPQAFPGRHGQGQVSRTQFAVPRGALAYWAKRLPTMGGRIIGGGSVPGDTGLVFTDPDGLELALVETDDTRAPWTGAGIPETVAIRGFRGVTLNLGDTAPVAALLRDVFGYEDASREGALTRLTTDAPSGVVDLIETPGAVRGSDGAGTVHHVAFRVADRAAQVSVRERMQAAGLSVTQQIDRDYFWAIYARTPGGVLFEVATDEPGFTVDEPLETLGTELRLPTQHEPLRARIEQVLPPLHA
jgi:glyoxalase family protein